MEFSMLGLFRRIAELSDSHFDYLEACGSAIALFCMFEGKIPRGAGRRNVTRAWNEKIKLPKIGG